MKQFDLLNENRTIVCAHRGVWGGNIPCNTVTAFDIAILQGADMIELDITASADGEMFVFHPGMEKRMLGLPYVDIRTLPADQVKKLRYVNLDGAETEEAIPLLDDVLEHLKGKCYINVDKFGHYPAQIMQKIQSHNIKDQIVVKSAPRDEVLRTMREIAPDIHYLAIISDRYDPWETHELLMRQSIGYVGLEVVFEEDSSPLVGDGFIERLHRDGKLLWGNSILFNYRHRLAGEHSDDTALRGDPDKGWGWFVKKKFDIIQTDWARELCIYLDHIHAR